MKKKQAQEPKFDSEWWKSNRAKGNQIISEVDADNTFFDQLKHYEEKRDSGIERSGYMEDCLNALRRIKVIAKKVTTSVGQGETKTALKNYKQTTSILLRKIPKLKFPAVDRPLEDLVRRRHKGFLKFYKENHGNMANYELYDILFTYNGRPSLAWLQKEKTIEGLNISGKKTIKNLDPNDPGWASEINWNQMKTDVDSIVSDMYRRFQSHYRNFKIQKMLPK